MLSRLRPRRPSHGTVVAYAALFVALGGSAYAAATIGSSDIKPNAILSKHIKDGQVKSADVAKNAIGSAQIVNNSVTGADINEQTLGRVPSAAHADQATNANHASSADSATQALNAASLGGSPASAYLKGSASFGSTPALTPVPVLPSCGGGEIGPEAQVTVSASGMLEVFAKAQVALNMSSTISGCLVIDGVDIASYVLISANTDFTWYTSSATLGGTQNEAKASWLTAFVAPGSHTVSIDWTGTGSSGTVSNRELLVRSVP